MPTLEIQPVAPPAAALASSSPLIAVCMATFDPPLELFQRQIESIRAQTHHNWVCVISDDNSRPERLAAIREVLGGDERFVLVPSEVRRGFYGNFERALALAPPEAGYLALSDQDDRWHPDKLEVLLGELEGGALLAYSDTRVVDESGRVLSDTYWRYRANNYTDFTSLVITNAITGAASLFRRELVERGLPFPPPHGDIFHDHWLALVAMATGEIRYVDRPLYDYVQHSAAALGFSKANAGRGRWGGWLADVTLRMLRLVSRAVRPVGQVRYFENYCRLVLEAQSAGAATRRRPESCGTGRASPDPRVRRHSRRRGVVRPAHASPADRAQRDHGHGARPLGRAPVAAAGGSPRPGRARTELRVAWRAAAWIPCGRARRPAGCSSPETP